MECCGKHIELERMVNERINVITSELHEKDIESVKLREEIMHGILELELKQAKRQNEHDENLSQVENKIDIIENKVKNISNQLSDINITTNGKGFEDNVPLKGTNNVSTKVTVNDKPVL